MGKIIISRTAEWNNRLRQIGIYVDGKEIGTVGNGEVKTFEVPDGNHSIKAKINWCGSRDVEFSFSVQEKKYFKLSGFKYGFMVYVMLAIVMINSILRLYFKKGWNQQYVSWLLVPFVLVLFYYLTLGRNDYLRLKETESW